VARAGTDDEAVDDGAVGRQADDGVAWDRNGGVMSGERADRSPPAKPPSRIYLAVIARLSVQVLRRPDCVAAGGGVDRLDGFAALTQRTEPPQAFRPTSTQIETLSAGGGPPAGPVRPEPLTSSVPAWSSAWLGVDDEALS
jgi:hypothetical protein